MALAAETSDRPTMLGTRALRVEPSQPLRAAATAGRMKRVRVQGEPSAGQCHKRLDRQQQAAAVDGICHRAAQHGPHYQGHKLG